MVWNANCIELTCCPFCWFVRNVLILCIASFVELDWLNNKSFQTEDALSLHNRYLEKTENVWTKKEQRCIYNRIDRRLTISNHVCLKNS